MEDIDTRYNDSNRAFLQAFLARGTLTIKEAKPVLAAIFSTATDDEETSAEDVTEDDFHSYVNAANNAISPFDFAIRSTLSQHDRTRIYALVNTTSDPLTQLATTYTADEISYIKRLLDAMFETYNSQRQEVMAIQSTAAARLLKPPTERAHETQNGGATQGSSGQGLTGMAGERVLKDLVQQGWFEKSQAGFYTLSPRALMELKYYLLTTYNGGEDDEDQEEAEERQDKVKLCMACKEIVTIGQRCTRRECPCRLHNICTQGYFRVQRAETCPICKTEWTGNNLVGERAITTTDAWQRGRRSGGGGGHSRARGDNEMDED